MKNETISAKPRQQQAARMFQCEEINARLMFYDTSINKYIYM